jgi:predicted alpha-1,2-mannosidase
VAEKYLRRSRNWTKLWDSSSGSVRPRYADGRWLSPFDPNDAGSPHFYEGSAFQYTTMVPHDVQGLIVKMGGEGRFVAWLDRFFGRQRFDPSNEPDLLAPFLYLHAGRPDRTADVTRRLLSEGYRTGRDGLPGNDDAGAMSAWFVWTALGLFPNPGHDWYYVGAPLFPAATLRLAGDRTLRITAPGASDTNRYVRSVRLNGRALTGPWVRHQDLLRGGTLAYVLGSKPSTWGRDNRPPSVTPR